jgi:hypothetical protein
MKCCSTSPKEEIREGLLIAEHYAMVGMILFYREKGDLNI